MKSSDVCLRVLLLTFFRFIISIPVYTHKGQLKKRACSSFLVTDPYWHYQWYLNSSSSVYRDMNVLEAWRKCYNGTGITIAVVDDGLNDNPDLNIDRSLDDDVDITIPKRKTHGTWVAGVIAGKANNVCGIGIAFGARLADKRVLTGTIIQDSVRASLFVSSLSKIDIYSSSFNARTDGISVNHIGPKLLESLQRGTTEGRNGHGAIYVWSTGNGGDVFFPHGCAYEGYVNNPYVIAVAGVQWNYNKLRTGDQCSSIMVASFTRDPYDNEHPIVTCDGVNNCSTNFGRNSAAVPMVSGAIALTLQANPLLGYRDIMHILTRSSVSDLPFVPQDFVTNGAGFNVSKTFGFGLLDIAKMVDLAELWENSRPLRTCVYFSNITCSYLSNRTVTIDSNRCQISSLEHVEIVFKILSPRAGTFKLDLMSPSRTVSNIVPGRRLDRRNELNLTVISVHFWGESPIGQWNLLADDLENNYFDSNNGTMQFLKLMFYGTGNNTLVPTKPTASNTRSTTEMNTNDAFTKPTPETVESIISGSTSTTTTTVTPTESQPNETTKTITDGTYTATETVTLTETHPHGTTKNPCRQRESNEMDTSDEECLDTNIVTDNGVAKSEGISVGAIVGGILSAICLGFIILLIRRKYSSPSQKLNCLKQPSSVENRSVNAVHISQIRREPIKSTFI